MLERFHVPHDVAVKVNHKEIFDVVKNICEVIVRTTL